MTNRLPRAATCTRASRAARLARGYKKPDSRPRAATTPRASRAGCLARGYRIACFVLLLAGCQNGEPVPEYFTTIEYLVDSSDKARLVSEIESATERIDVAVTGLADEEIARAVIAAKNNGAEVRVVADADFNNDPGIDLIQEADIDVVFGDGELAYLPDPNLGGVVDRCGLKDNVVQCPPPMDSEDVPRDVMFRPGSFNLQSHNFFIIDKRTIWNFAQPFDGSDGPKFGFRAESERMREVFVREFNQLHGGVFSTTLDIYNGPVKSSPQSNPDFNAQSYLTATSELEVRFNPQDRLTKTIIDDTYRAQASVFIMTDNLAEDFLIDALRYKANATIPGTNEKAFEVRVVVNSAAQSEYSRQALEELGVVRYAPASMERLPTIALYDSRPDADGENKPRRVHVATQPIWRAGPFDVFRPGSSPLCPDGNTDCVVIHPADYFVDGNMWSLLEYRGQIGAVTEIDRVESFFNDVWEQSEAP